MNFLSHYFFDHNKNDHHFNFGLILPDLARNFAPGTRIKSGNAPNLEGNIKSIDLGCEQHHLTDSFFHQWDGFEVLQAEIKKKLREKDEIRPERDWFVAHIFAELMIDHQLLLTYPNLATELYTSFEQVNTVSMVEYLRLNNVDEGRISPFLKGFDRFMEVQYLKYYDDPETVVYSLERIYTRMKLPPFDVRQKTYYVQLISHLDRIIVDSIAKLQTHLQ